MSLQHDAKCMLQKFQHTDGCAPFAGHLHCNTATVTMSGKTLALMCASLAWQQQQCGGQAAKQVPPGPETPRIFWAARTHAQIDHAVREVRSAVSLLAPAAMSGHEAARCNCLTDLVLLDAVAGWQCSLDVACLTFGVTCM